jgi:hypothetical protein
MQLIATFLIVIGAADDMNRRHAEQTMQAEKF